MVENNNSNKGLKSCCMIGCLGIVALIAGIIIVVALFFGALFSLLSADTGSTAVEGIYQFPLENVQITSHFDPNRILPEVYGDNTPRPHNGTDFQAAMGTTVLCPRDGVVRDAYTSTAGGITLVIDHGGGHTTRYLHLSGYLVNVGDTVTVGQSIALSGNSGTSSSGPHLHFEIRIDGTPVDAMEYLPAT